MWNEYKSFNSISKKVSPFSNKNGSETSLEATVPDPDKTKLSPETKLLNEEGFFNIPSFLKPETLHFIVKLFDPDEKLKKITKYDNWFFTFGDYDVF